LRMCVVLLDRPAGARSLTHALSLSLAPSLSLALSLSLSLLSLPAAGVVPASGRSAQATRERKKPARIRTPADVHILKLQETAQECCGDGKQPAQAEFLGDGKCVSRRREMCFPVTGNISRTRETFPGDGECFPATDNVSRRREMFPGDGKQRAQEPAQAATGNGVPRRAKTRGRNAQAAHERELIARIRTRTHAHGTRARLHRVHTHAHAIQNTH
jgi:hypothetical protein